MKTWRSLPFAIGLLAMLVIAALLVVTGPEPPPPENPSRGAARTLVDLAPERPWRPESTGLFVGVQKFPHDDALTVPYAVDDAVDLAYQFSLDQRSSLVPPRRVVLALSGKPQKEESKRRLEELLAAEARVERATSGDIQNLLKEQVAKAGDHGLFVLSLATHGFLDGSGDAYVLGSTSEIGSTATALPMETVLDIAGQAARSLVFIDACRDRIGTTSRGAAPDPLTRAPLIGKMQRIRGQVVFYAAAPDRYAFDDEVHQNGVFTRAVLEGLDCKASAPRGEIIAETLHTYVEREVRRWIVEHEKGPDGPATQISTEGSTRNMPLAQCWRSPKSTIRASIDGTTVNAYNDETRLLWQKKNLGRRILQTEVADLDADALQEVVVGTDDALIAFDRDGRELWRKQAGGMSLAALTTADLFRKHTTQIVALWTSGHTSRVTVVDSEGNERSSDEYTGRFQNVAVLRPTNHHYGVIAITSSDRVYVIDAKKLSARWGQILRSSADAILGLHIHDRDTRWRDLAVSTKNGTTLFDFEGAIRSTKAEWVKVGKRKKAD